jgi:hypothetical protein
MLRVPHFTERGIVQTDEAAGAALGHPIAFEVHPAASGGRAPDLDEHRGEGFRPRA